MAEKFVFSFGTPAKRKAHNNIQVEVSCHICGKIRTLPPCRVGKRNYCSAVCRNTALRTGVIKPTGRPVSVWTEERVSLLREHFPHMPNADLHAKFFPDESIRGMMWKATDLGLSKTKAAKRLALAETYRKNGVLSRSRAKPAPQYQCPICNSSFKRRDSAVKSPEAKRYCSKQCSDFAKTQVTGTEHKLYCRVETLCQWCDKPFTVKRTHAINPERGRFCSRQCVGGYASSLQDGRASSIERAVEAELIRRQVNFQRQKKMAHFVVDFYLPDRRLVIECDGKYWHAKPEIAARDKRKDAWLTSHGQKIVRLGEDEINADCEAAVNRALAA